MKVGHLNVPYDYKFDLISDNSSTDLEKVVREIKRKNPMLVGFATTDFNFLQESTARKGKWITFGENSPLKDQTELRCFLQATAASPGKPFKLLLSVARGSALRRSRSSEETRQPLPEPEEHWPCVRQRPDDEDDKPNDTVQRPRRTAPLLSYKTPSYLL